MGFGSYLRFFIGLFLAIEVIRQLILGNELSIYATVFAILFIALSVAWFIGRAGLVPLR